MKRHQCRWVEQERFWAAPFRGDFAGACTSEDFRQLAMGVTSIVYVCSEGCGSLPQIQRVLGRHVSEAK